MEFLSSSVFCLVMTLQPARYVIRGKSYITVGLRGQKRPKELQQLRPAALKKFDLKYPTLTFSQILSTALTLFPAYHQQMRQNTSLLKRRLAQRKNLASEIVLFSNVLKNTHSWTDIRKCFWHLCDLTLRSYSWRVSRVSLRRSDLSSMSSLKGWLEGEKDTEGRN